MVEDWDNVEYRLSYEVPIYETSELSQVNELCFKYLEFTEEMMQWCKDNVSYVNLSIISPGSGSLEDTVYKITFYTKEEYEEFCKRFKYEIREPDVNTHGCNEKGQLDMEKGDDKVSEQPEEQGIRWTAFCKEFDSLEDHTLGYIKLVLKDYKNPWEELSAERKDAVKCMIRDYWYAHSKELVDSVKKWLDFSKIPLTAVTLSELLGEQYCVETLCLGKEARDSLFHMTSTGRIYKDAVLKKFSDWFETFDCYGPPTLEYSLQHISEVEGIDVDAISNEIKEEVRKMIDKKTKEIEARGKVTQERDSNGRFTKSSRKIRVDSHLYADSVVGIYDYLRLAEYRVAEDFHDTERVLFVVKYVGGLLNSADGITEEEGSDLISMRFGLDSYCKVKDFVGSTGREVTIWIPHNMYFAGSRDNLIPFILTYEDRNRFPVDIKYPCA